MTNIRPPLQNLADLLGGTRLPGLPAAERLALAAVQARAILKMLDATRAVCPPPRRPRRAVR